MMYVYSILSIFMQNAWWTKQSYKEKSVKNMKKKYAPVMSPCPLNVKMRSLRLAAVYECSDNALNLGAHLGHEVVHEQVELEPPVSDVVL